MEFSAVVRSGSRAATDTVVVHVKDSGVDRPARAGFVVGRAVGSAVVRKRVTRRLRHVTLPHLLALSPGTDVVVRARPQAAQATATDLSRDLSSALRRAVGRLGHQVRTPAVMSQ